MILPMIPGNADNPSNVACRSCGQSEYRRHPDERKIESASIFKFLLLIKKLQKNRKNEFRCKNFILDNCLIQPSIV